MLIFNTKNILQKMKIVVKQNVYIEVLLKKIQNGKEMVDERTENFCSKVEVVRPIPSEIKSNLDQQRLCRKRRNQKVKN